MKYFKYLRYIIRHKWFVLLACLRHGLIWQGLIHDLSKFRPSEFFPYCEWFYGTENSTEDIRRCFAVTGSFLPSKRERQDNFDKAWLLHQHRNPHHWQHWILRFDDGSSRILDMPRKYILEMLADWEGAGMAISGTNDTRFWYLKNYRRIQISQMTRALVNETLGIKDSDVVALDAPIMEGIEL